MSDRVNDNESGFSCYPVYCPIVIHYLYISMICGLSSCACCCFNALLGCAGNVKKTMSNARYYTVFLIWMLFCIIIQFLPNNDVT